MRNESNERRAISAQPTNRTSGSNESFFCRLAEAIEFVLGEERTRISRETRFQLPPRRLLLLVLDITGTTAPHRGIANFLLAKNAKDDSESATPLHDATEKPRNEGCCCVSLSN